MKKIAMKSGVMVFAVLAAALVLAAFTANKDTVTEIVINGGFPSGSATQPPLEGGAAIQQPNLVNVNNNSYGQVFNLGNSNVTNTTWSNYTFINSNECGSVCNPANGNCTVVNVSLVRASTGVIQDSKKICTGQGYPVHLPGGAYFYSYFKTVLTTEAGVAPSEYTVNATANNGTRIGRNNTAGATLAFLSVWLTNGMPGVPPQWYGNQSITAYMYNPANVSNFTIAWADNNYMGTVLVESNFSGAPVNYSMANFTPEYYSYLNVLPAGSFYWKSYGADGEPTWNVSDTWYFMIAQSDTNIADLYLNGAPNQNVGITYGAQSNATATAVAGAKLYRNGTYVGNNETATLPAAVYEYKANATGNQNYTANNTGVTYYLTVNKAPTTTTLYIDGSQANKTVTYGTQTNATVTTSAGSVTLYRNGQVVSNPEIITLGVGTYNYTAVNAGNENYTASSATWWVTVNKASTTTTLYVDGAQANKTVTYGTQTNATALTSVLSLTLYRNGQAVANPDVIVLGAGTYNYTAVNAGNENYTASSATWWVTVNKADNPVSLYLNGNLNQNATINYGTQSNATGSSTYLTASLYRDGAAVSNPEVKTLAAGTYAYKVNATGNANYSDNTTGLTYYLIVNKAGMPLTLLLNGTDGDRNYLNNTAANFTIVTQVSGLPVFLYTNYSNGINKLWNNGNSPFTNITTLEAYGGWNFTAYYAGNNNYTASTAAHYAVVSKEATSITILFNGGAGTSFNTGINVNITAVMNVTGRTVYLFTNLTNYTQSGTTSVENVSVFSTAGIYNVTAWFLGDTDYLPSNTTAYLTITAPAPPAPPGGGGGGGGAAIGPAANVTPAPAPAPVPTPPPTVAPSANIEVSVDKLTYSSTETVHITVTTKNTGSMSLINAVIKEKLTWPGGSKAFDDRMVDILPGETNVNIRDVPLDGLPDEVYIYEAQIIYSGNMLDKATTTFIVATPQPIAYYAVPTAALGSALILLWGARRPLSIRKVIIPIMRGSKVNFKLTNRTRHVYKNVIITDTVPAKVAAAGVTPKPTTSTKMPNGSMKFEWHIAHMMPKEKRDFHYTLNKRKYLLPRAKVVKYERDRELEERLAKKEIQKVQRGILGKLRAKRAAAHAPPAKPSKPAAHKVTSAKPSKPAARKPVKPSKPIARKTTSVRPSQPVKKPLKPTAKAAPSAKKR